MKSLIGGQSTAQTGADPARVHWVHVHPSPPFVSEYMFIVCSMLEAHWIKGALSIL